MSDGRIRVCGRHGMVTWCPSCTNWQPFYMMRDSGIAPERGAWCRACDNKLPVVSTYKAKDAKATTTKPCGNSERGGNHCQLTKDHPGNCSYPGMADVEANPNPGMLWWGPAVRLFIDLPIRGRGEGDARRVQSENAIYVWSTERQDWVQMFGPGLTNLPTSEEKA